MKNKKFKLEKKIVEEVYNDLKKLLSRAKHVIAFIENENSKEEYISNVLILYCNTVLNYMLELEKILMLEGISYLINKELIEKLNNYKKIIVTLEDQINFYSKYSLKAH